MSAPVFFLRYVPHAKADAYERLGWRRVGPLSGNHGLWSCLMRWDGDAPVEPQ